MFGIHKNIFAFKIMVFYTIQLNNEKYTRNLIYMYNMYLYYEK